MSTAYGKCPKCHRSSKFTIKYMPLIKVPDYASFQPVETLAVCGICNKAGIIKKEMLPMEMKPFKGDFWTEDEIEEYKL